MKGWEVIPLCMMVATYLADKGYTKIACGENQTTIKRRKDSFPKMKWESKSTSFYIVLDNGKQRRFIPDLIREFYHFETDFAANMNNIISDISSGEYKASTATIVSLHRRCEEVCRTYGSTFPITKGSMWKTWREFFVLHHKVFTQREKGSPWKIEATPNKRIFKEKDHPCCLGALSKLPDEMIDAALASISSDDDEVLWLEFLDIMGTLCCPSLSYPPLNKHFLLA